MVPSNSTIPPRQILLRVAAMMVCVFLWPAMVTFDPGDFPSPHQFPHNYPIMNACGTVGAWCSYYLHHYLGDGAYPLLLFVTLAAVMKLIRGTIGNVLERVSGLALFVVCTCAAVHLVPSSATPQLPVGHGGVVGHALGEFLNDNLKPLGTLIVLGCCLFVGLLFATEGWVLRLPAMLRRAGEVSGEAVTVARGWAYNASSLRTAPAPIGKDSGNTPGKLRINPDRPGRKENEPDDQQESLFDEPEVEQCEDVDDTDVNEQCEQEEVFDEEEPDAEDAPLDESKRDVRLEGQSAPIVNFSSPQRQPAGAYPREIENWTLPSIDLLHEPEYGFTAQQEVVVREQARTLELTLEEFRLDAHVVEIDTGPVITMFELKLGAGIKVSQIASLSNDIARALKAHAVRVVAPIPGKNTIGIEVPNLEKEAVRIKELMTLAGRKASGMRLPLFIGKDAAGAPLVADLTKMPHLLIAGTTGSGKSVCINSIIVSLLMTKRPDHVKLILVDPKMVEMSHFKEVPHLMCPIVTDLGRAEKILEWAVTKMDEQYELLAECRVKNIAEYNNLGPEGIYERLKPANDREKAQITTHVPYIVIIIDELADLMMTSAKEVEHHLSRLAQKSRAVGVHIIVATQRPEAKVVTGLIKSNMPSRISFRVASRMDSRIVLDQNGGEVLMGQGDMLFLPPGTHKLIRAQGTFLHNDEVEAVIDDLTGRAKPEFHPELVRLPASGGEGSGVRDPLFEQAVDIILETKRGSVSLLQRRLTVGYSRASRLIDQMADAGIVGEYKGSQAREVLISAKEWKHLQKQVAADLKNDYEADQDTLVEDPFESDVDDEASTETGSG